jgi:RND family efflux transporter MFP subunit
MTSESKLIHSREDDPRSTLPAPKGGSITVPLAIAALTGVLIGTGIHLYRRAHSAENHVALASAPKPVTAVAATKASFRKTHRYVATVEPWASAKVGPQLVSAYVDTVLFRPGAAVTKGDVLATLDCRNASAEAQAVAMAARALEAKEKALSAESARLSGMLDGGFVSPNEAEKKQAETASAQAEILAQKAKVLGSSLEVNDCILRSPFTGEIAEREVDPGAFVRPGAAMLTVVDRSTVRVVADVPEVDFAAVAPGAIVSIRYVALGKTASAPIARRVPSADPATRTIRLEIDVPDAGRSIPVGTTAELSLEYGDRIEAASLPLSAATVRGERATMFVVDGDHAKKASTLVLGEVGGVLYVEPSFAGRRLVTEGRALLADGDAITATEAQVTP